MPLRLARYSDLDSIAHICATSFHDTEVIGSLLHPYRLQYPQDYLAFWERKCWQRWWSYSHIFIVSFEQDEKDGKERLIGVAEWSKIGTGQDKVWGLWGRWDPRRIMEPIAAFVTKVVNRLWPNRAASKDPLFNPDGFYRSTFPFIVEFFTSPPHRLNRWHLSSISVLPEYENRGHGRQLVAWGLEKAKQDGVTAGVLAARGKETFYQRCGFTQLAGWASDGESNPMRGRIGGGAILYTPVKEDEVAKTATT